MSPKQNSLQAFQESKAVWISSVLLMVVCVYLAWPFNQGLAQEQKRTPTAGTTSGYLGCFIDDYGRLLSDDRMIGDQSMTNAKCRSFYAVGGFRYAGTEYGQECYCGNRLRSDPPPISAPETQCDYQCKGNAQEFCGGLWCLSVFGPPIARAQAAEVKFVRKTDKGFEAIADNTLRYGDLFAIEVTMDSDTKPDDKQRTVKLERGKAQPLEVPVCRESPKIFRGEVLRLEPPGSSETEMDTTC